MADRVVALVNDEPILLSEIINPFSFDSESQPKEPQENLEARINQLLIIQETNRLRIFDVSLEEIVEFERKIIEDYGGILQFQQKLQAHKLTRNELRAKIKENLLIEKYIDFSFRRKIDITPEEVKEYFDQTILPALGDKAKGAFENHRKQIRILLLERKINKILTSWLDETRDQARIVILY